MAKHATILTWRIPWTEEPGGPQSKASQSETTEHMRLCACAHTHTHTHTHTLPISASVLQGVTETTECVHTHRHTHTHTHTHTLPISGPLHSSFLCLLFAGLFTCCVLHFQVSEYTYSRGAFGKDIIYKVGSLVSQLVSIKTPSLFIYPFSLEIIHLLCASSTGMSAP